MKTLNPIRADIIALDAEDRPVLLIEVKGRPQENIYDRQQLVDDLREAGHVLPYAMLVTLEDIRIFHWDGAALFELVHLPTADALSFYDPEFREKRIYGDYLTALVETWLRDVAYRWKSDAPPFLTSLDRIGLAERLGGGTTENVRYAETHSSLP